MTELEKFISEQISHIVPNFEKLEVRANIGDSSYSVEFFATVDGTRMQCFDMVDEGLIKEKDLDTVSKSIANYMRCSSDYNIGNINKISVIISR
ncbi:hypothetical protein [Lacrimispora brassicae]